MKKRMKRVFTTSTTGTFCNGGIKKRDHNNTEKKNTMVITTSRVTTGTVMFNREQHNTEKKNTMVITTSTTGTVMNRMFHRIDHTTQKKQTKMMRSVRMNLFRVKCSAKRALIPFLLVITLMMFFYILSLSIGGISFFISVMSKVAGFIGVKALSSILKKVGCSSTLASVIGCFFRAVVTTEASPSLAHWMLPGPSHQPHVAEDNNYYFPDRYAVAHRSAPPEGLEIMKPLIEDQERYGELESRLTPHFLGKNDQETRILFDDLVEKQLLIEKEIESRLLIEIRLLNDEYSGEHLLSNRHEMRECLFYKKGAPLKEKTLDLYLKELQSNPYQSVPYRRIKTKFKNFFDQ